MCASFRYVGVGVHGDIITTAASANARASMRAAAGNLDAWWAMPRAADPANVELIALPSAVLDRGIARARADIVWCDDKRCSQRAIIGAQMINEAAGMPAPIDDAVAAGYAYAEGTFTNGFAGNRFQWDFHVAPVVQFADEAEPRVVDFALFSKPVSKSAWEGALGMPGGAAELRHPANLRFMGVGDAVAGRPAILAGDLERTWAGAEQAGAVNNPTWGQRSITWSGAASELSGRAKAFANREARMFGDAADRW